MRIKEGWRDRNADHTGKPTGETKPTIHHEKSKELSPAQQSWSASFCHSLSQSCSTPCKTGQRRAWLQLGLCIDLDLIELNASSVTNNQQCLSTSNWCSKAGENSTPHHCYGVGSSMLGFLRNAAVSHIAQSGPKVHKVHKHHFMIPNAAQVWYKFCFLLLCAH